MESFNVYVLTKLSLDNNGGVVSRNLGVTFSLHEAEAHREKGVENDYETFEIESNWREDAATTDLVVALRQFREIVEMQQEEALR